MKNDEEMYRSLLMRFEAFQEKKQKRRRILRHTVSAAVCLCAAALLLLGYRTFSAGRAGIPVQSGLTAAPEPEIPTAAVTEPALLTSAEAHRGTTAPVSAPVSAQSTEAVLSVPEETPPDAEVNPLPVSEPEQTVRSQAAPQTTAAKNVQTAPPATAASTAPPPAVQTTAAPETPGNSGSPGTPGAVFTSRTVSYDEARALFAHPILPCGREDFLQYKAGIVSRNGNLHADGTFCLSVTYEFADGQITLTDWDRMNGSDGSPEAEQIEYCGKTFYAERPDAYDNSLRIAYYAAGFDPFALHGIEYKAVFGSDADIYAVMELIRSLETETE